MPGANAGWPHYGRRAQRDLAAEAASLYEFRVYDPAIQAILARLRRSSGGNLLRDRGTQRRIGILHRQHQRRETLSIENSRPLLYSYGRLRSYVQGLYDLRCGHDLRDLRHCDGGMRQIAEECSIVNGGTVFQFNIEN